MSGGVTAGRRLLSKGRTPVTDFGPSPGRLRRFFGFEGCSSRLGNANLPYMDSDEGVSLDNRVLWAISIAALVIALFAYFGADDPRTGCLYAGSTLELVGFVLVLLALELRLERFGAGTGFLISAGRWVAGVATWTRGKVRRAVQWVAKKFGWKPPPKTVSVGTAEAKATAQPVGVIQTGADDNELWGMLGRLNRLEQSLEELEDRVDTVEFEAREARTKLQEDLEGEIQELRQELRGEIEGIKSTLRESIAQGYSLEALGVVLFVAGIVLGTWGPALFF